jgi:hypothetical protein
LYLKARNVYYRLSDNLSIRLNNLISRFEPSIPDRCIVLNDFESYELSVSSACALIHKHQFIILIENIIFSIFKITAPDVKIHFEPRNVLEINLSPGKLVPVKIKGKLVTDCNNTICYKFSSIKVFGIPVSSLFEAIKSIPGLNISYHSKDGKSEIQNDCIKIFVDKYIPDLNLKYSISDVYFNEEGFQIELKDKVTYEIDDKMDINLPDSYALFTGGKLKIDNVEIFDTKIAFLRNSGKPFAFNFATYRDLIDSGTFVYNKNNEIIFTLEEFTSPVTINNDCTGSL